MRYFWILATALTEKPELSITVPDGNNWTVELYSQAADGETNQIITVGPFKIDTISPTASLMPFTRAWVTNANFNVKWPGTDSNLDTILYFDVQYTQNNNGLWTPWLSHTQTISQVFNGLDDTAYTFRVRAEDEAGNKRKNRTLDKGKR